MALLTALDIVNAACARIGAEPLQDLDEETLGGQAASLIYEELVSFNFGVHPFSFARKIVQLAKVTNAVPLSGWTLVFDLPPERVGPPIYLSDDITDPDRRFTRYTLVEATVHSDAEPLFACIKFMPAPHLWSPTFRSVTITALASRLAYSLASDRQTMDELHREAYGSPVENCRGGQMRAAITEDSLATPPRKPDWKNNPLERAWRSG